MTKSEVFGAGPDGETVTRVFLSGGGLAMNVLTWGSIIQDLRLEGHAPPLVLGFDTMPDYLRHSPFFGVTPGRNANRVAKGRIAIDGIDYQLERNERDVTHLHGGKDGIAFRNKVYGIGSTSDGMVGGARALIDCRKIVQAGLGAILIPDKIEIGRAQDAFDEAGELIPEPVSKLLKSLCRHLVQLSRQLAD